jgi:TonB family protein
MSLAINSKNPADLFIAVTAVLLLGVAAAWFLVDSEPMHEDITRTELAESVGRARTAVRDSASVQRDSLEKARLAMDAGQLLSPPGASAYFYYSQALATDPLDEEAKAGMEQVLDTAAAMAETALAAQRFDEVHALLAELEQAAPENPRTAAVGAAISERRQELLDRANRLVGNERYTDAESLLAQAESLGEPEAADIIAARQALAAAREESAARKEAAAIAAARATRTQTASKAVPGPEKVSGPTLEEQVASLLASARERIEADQLVAPRSDSALFYVEEARGLAPDDADLAQTREALAVALVARARTALAADNFPDTEKWLAYATSLQVLEEEIGKIDEASRARQAELQSRRVVPMQEMVLLRFEEPKYPTRAAREQLSGWADVEFTVDVDGIPKDIEITDVSKRGYFESATRQAVSKWLFQPKNVHGHTIEQRVGVRVTFDLDG